MIPMIPLSDKRPGNDHPVNRGICTGKRFCRYNINLPLWFRIQIFLSYPSLTMTLHICIAIWCMQSAIRTKAPLLFYLLFHSDGAKIDSHIDIAPSDKNLADHRGNREWRVEPRHQATRHLYFVFSHSSWTKTHIRIYKIPTTLPQHLTPSFFSLREFFNMQHPRICICIDCLQVMSHCDGNRESSASVRIQMDRLTIFYYC